MDALENVGLIQYESGIHRQVLIYYIIFLYYMTVDKVKKNILVLRKGNHD